MKNEGGHLSLVELPDHNGEIDGGIIKTVLQETDVSCMNRRFRICTRMPLCKSI